MTATQDERLQRLADAYGVNADREAVADAIISSVHASSGLDIAPERQPLIAVVWLLVEDEACLSAFEAGHGWSDQMAAELNQMPQAVRTAVILNGSRHFD